MKAIRFYEHGGPEVLHLEELSIPEPRHDEVLVRIEAAGVQCADTMRQRGASPAPTLLPFIPGQQIVGTIVAVGNQVTTYVPGTPHWKAPTYVRAMSARARRVLPVNKTCGVQFLSAM